ALQTSWTRTSGRYNMMFNYTFGKSMGILTGGQTDLFNLDNNYGVLPSNRKHIFNAAYSIELGNPVTGQRLLGGIVNGWQLSGITQIQSGQNIAAVQNFFTNDVNFEQNAAGDRYTIPVNGARYQINNRTVNGTPALPWRPLINCSLTSNLVDKQYVNGSCLALPTGPGQSGPTVTPPVYGPAYVNSDLGLFKNFEMGESKRLQFRFNAYNFLNHPLWSFINGSANLKPTFDVNGKQTNSIFGLTTENKATGLFRWR
ncbi:MAG: carboxypeptidase regulatory-like domain-containing protein, partial [Bryobacteraceae bacterium]